MVGQTLTIVSHPFSSNGMGEQGRSGLRALLAVGQSPKIYDLFRYAARKDPDYRELVRTREIATLPDGVRIFHINGDEVESALSAIAAQGSDFKNGYNIIVPAWELPTYPHIWEPALRNFNEIWAISHFVQIGLKEIGLKSEYIGQSVNVAPGYLLPRQYFGIRESAFVLLNFFDTASYSQRKNPAATIRLYNRFRKLRPYDDVQLILKVRSGDQDTADLENAIDSEIPRDAVVIPNNFMSHEIRSLIAAADCLVSLHRSEGFGRGMAEAMDLSRLALATGWSGNCDFMSPDNSLFVKYSLVEVQEGHYPHSQGQKWAEPDQDHALYLLLKAIDDPSWAQQIRRRGRMSVMARASNRSVGTRALQRLKLINRAHQ
jgi:hypothetical protein